MASYISPDQTASEYDPSVGAVVCKGDLLDQTRVIYEKLAVVLEAAGMSFDNVVQTVDYIDPSALPQYRETAQSAASSWWHSGGVHRHLRGAVASS